MFALQRQQKIMELLGANKSVDVGVLSNLFGVSEVTIRRDLSKLENDGMLIKTYGGALLREDCYLEEEAEEDVSSSDEMGMVRLCAALVEERDSVFLGADPCSCRIARAIKGMPLSVITNDISVAGELSDAPSIRVFLIGSELVSGTNMLIGGYDEKMLSSLFIAKSFVRADGVDLNTGVTLSSPEECGIVSEILSMSQKLIVLARKQVFNKTSFSRLMKLETPQAIVSDTDIPKEYKEFFFDHSISLYTPFNLT